MAKDLPKSQKTIWVTGAGRSGTNLVGMLVDGHPTVNVFPYELRIIPAWLEATNWASIDGGETLPGALLEKLLLKPLLHKPRLEKMKINSSQLVPWGEQRVGFFEYIESLNKALFPGAANTFLYRAPGSQVDFFLSKAENSRASQAKVLLILRHPVQNYLAMVSHDLQKGLGYRSVAHMLPHLGLTSFLHLSLLRLLKAFHVVRQFTHDKRVVITRLESFSADSEERQRVWKELDIPFADSLETLTRVGETSLSSSGRWRTTEIKAVKTVGYPQILSETEYQVIAKCMPYFKSFYPDALENIEVISDRKADEMLMQREIDCLKADKNAVDKRNTRIRSIYAPLPKSISGLLSWPVRAGRILHDDVFFYPQARVKRMNSGHDTLLAGLEEVPELFGLLPEGVS